MAARVFLGNLNCQVTQRDILVAINDLDPYAEVERVQIIRRGRLEERAWRTPGDQQPQRGYCSNALAELCESRESSAPRGGDGLGSFEEEGSSVA